MILVHSQSKDLETGNSFDCNANLVMQIHKVKLRTQSVCLHVAAPVLYMMAVNSTQKFLLMNGYSFKDEFLFSAIQTLTLMDIHKVVRSQHYRQ